MSQTDSSPAGRPARLTVGVVGAGRVGAVLGAALDRIGHRVVAVSAVSGRSRARAALLVPAAHVVSPPEVLAAADLVLLTVPDDVLPGLVTGLVATGSIRPGQFLVHTSGRYGVAVLDPATREAALPLALHPAMTFTGTAADLPRLAGAAFGVTAPEALRHAAEALVLEIGAEPVWVPEELRPLWHAALAHGANHLVTVVVQSMDLLREAGVADPARVLGPAPFGGARQRAAHRGRRTDRAGRPW